VGLADPVIALDFDLAAAGRLLELERAALADSESGAGDRSPTPAQTQNLYW
jgi:hypothetical protein